MAKTKFKHRLPEGDEVIVVADIDLNLHLDIYTELDSNAVSPYAGVIADSTWVDLEEKAREQIEGPRKRTRKAG